MGVPREGAAATRARGLSPPANSPRRALRHCRGARRRIDASRILMVHEQDLAGSRAAMVVMRILIVEDEPKTAAYVSKGLAEHAYIVDIADNGIEGLHLASSGHYDLILLDVMLPGADGWTVLEALRRQRQTPVLLLSARDEVADRVKGLELGADDYLVKPFAFSELLARIRTLLRRGAAQIEQRVRLADLDVDRLRRRVSRGGERVELTAKEYALLDYFARHAGEVVSRTLIAEHVWDMNFDSDTNVVDVAVRRLRAKLDDPFPTKLIHTIRGVGYVLDARPG
jgi:two-component system copper resistance phosphate regulon response regulator CusR